MKGSIWRKKVAGERKCTKWLEKMVGAGEGKGLENFVLQPLQIPTQTCDSETPYESG